MMHNLFKVIGVTDKISAIQHIINAIPSGIYFTYYLLLISITLDTLFVSAFLIKYQIITAQQKNQNDFEYAYSIG